MDRRRLWRRIRLAWITLGLSLTVIFVGWSLIAYRASTAARVAIQPDSAVAIAHDDGIWSFVPRPSPSTERPSLIFFPGALVDPIAYAPLVHAAAAAGFPAYIVELPRRGAFGGADDPALAQRFNRLLSSANTPRRWVIAGHSRGAVVASQIAAEQRTGFAGLVLIGTSHPRDVDLSSVRVPVTKIVGTRDGLASRPEVEANREKLPSETRWLWIDGGNHSQFGWYGFQPGDRRATVDAATQRATMIQGVIDALRYASGVASASPPAFTSLQWPPLPPGYRREGGSLVHGPDGKEYGVATMRIGEDQELWLSRLVERDRAGDPHWERHAVLRLPRLLPGESYVEVDCALKGVADPLILAIGRWSRGDSLTSIRAAWRPNDSRTAFDALPPRDVTCGYDEDRR